MCWNSFPCGSPAMRATTVTSVTVTSEVHVLHSLFRGNMSGLQ